MSISEEKFPAWPAPHALYHNSLRYWLVSNLMSPSWWLSPHVSFLFLSFVSNTNKVTWNRLRPDISYDLYLIYLRFGHGKSRKMQELHTCIRTQIHAHCFFFSVLFFCVFVFTAGVPFRSSFRQRYIYWKASLNLNQEIQLKIYFYRPNNRHFCKYFQRSLCYVKASDIKYQANQCYSIMLPNASIGPKPVKKKKM